MDSRIALMIVWATISLFMGYKIVDKITDRNDPTSIVSLKEELERGYSEIP